MGGNFLSQLIVNAYLQSIDGKLDKSLIYRKENNEYLHTAFNPLLDRVHPFTLEPSLYAKLRTSKNIVINCTKELFPAVTNLGLYKQRYRQSGDLRSLPKDIPTDAWPGYQAVLVEIFPNKEYFEIDYEDMLININIESIQHMLDYLCIPAFMATDIAIQIENYWKNNKHLLIEMGYNG